MIYTCDCHMCVSKRIVSAYNLNKLTTGSMTIYSSSSSVVVGVCTMHKYTCKALWGASVTECLASGLSPVQTGNEDMFSTSLLKTYEVNVLM